MRITPEMEAQFNDNRVRMQTMERRLRIYMWIMVFLGAGIFGTAFMAGALSTLHDGAQGPGIFYTAMSTGMYQILLGIMTIITGLMTSSKKRTPCTVALAVYAVSAILVLLRLNGTFLGGNLIYLAAGIGLNIWAQLLLNENADLSQQVGYPHFVPQAAYRAEYEESADVAARRANASKHMEALGTPAMPFPPTEQDVYIKPEPMKIPEAAADPVFGNAPKPLGPTPSIRLPEEVNVSGPVNLDEMTNVPPVIPNPAPAQPLPMPTPENMTLENLDAYIKAQKEAALPQVNADDLLADMAAIPSHATMQGNPDMLPTPEEVRARMAAMKRAREEHLS